MKGIARNWSIKSLPNLKAVKKFLIITCLGVLLKVVTEKLGKRLFIHNFAS